MMTRALTAIAAFMSIAFATAASADFDRHEPQTGLENKTSLQSRVRPRASRMDGAVPDVIASRPAGCPHRFCGCALALKLFGRIVPRLNLASNWKSFPRAAASPGMVAARGGHVLELLGHVSGNVWSVWDPNSGGGHTRVHQRSILGYTVHNPRGAEIAATF
jgi:hypothetical protein